MVESNYKINFMTEILQFLNYDFHVIRQSQRRSLVIKLRPGFPNQILANQTTSKKVILDFLITKQNWLIKNLQKIEEFQNQIQIPDFDEGELFPVFGESRYFKYVETTRGLFQFSLEDGFLIAYVPNNKTELMGDRKFLQKKLIQFYKKLGEEYLIQRCDQLSQLSGLKPKQIKIQTARSRWGSCSSDQTIHLNWKLTVFPLILIDYVIIHELCHLRHMNHSKQFWSLVEQNFPNYKEVQSHLKEQTQKAIFLDLIQV